MKELGVEQICADAGAQSPINIAPRMSIETDMGLILKFPGDYPLSRFRDALTLRTSIGKSKLRTTSETMSRNDVTLHPTGTNSHTNYNRKTVALVSSA